MAVTRSMKKLKPTKQQRYLTDDIIFSILYKLPVKSLLRFTCVSKSWNDMITSSDFVSAHCRLNQIDNKNSCSDNLLIYMPDDDFKTQQICTSVRGRGGNALPQHDLVLPLRAYRVVGVCEGLICLTSRSYLAQGSRICIWNPLTKSLKKVPPGGAKPWEGNRMPLDYRTVLGFGFARGSSDYRVVNIVHRASHYFKVEIYSLAADSWRSIETNEPEARLGYCTSSRPTVFFEGSIYWLAKSIGHENSDVVLSFDVEEEMFAVTAAPLLSNGAQTKLAVANGSLVLLEVVLRNLHVSTWIFNKESLESPWDNAQSLLLPKKDKKNKKFVEITDCGHIVLVQNQDQRLFVFDYDGVGFKLRDLGIYRKSKRFHLTSMVTETLLWIDQHQKE